MVSPYRRPPVKRTITLNTTEIVQAVKYFLRENVDMSWDQDDLVVQLVVRNSTNGHVEAVVTTQSEEEINFM